MLSDSREIRLAAELSELTARQIADLLGVRHNSISARATREQWPCRGTEGRGPGPKARLFEVANLPPGIREQLVPKLRRRKPRRVRASKPRDILSLLRERLEISTVELEDYRDGIRESGMGADGRYACACDEIAARELSEEIALNRAALARCDEA